MTSHEPAAAGARRTTVQVVAALVGAVFLVVGVLGFIPGITTHYGQLEFAGHDSGAELLGLFQVSILHNVVHLLFGVVGLAMARGPRSATGYLVVGGLVYGVLWIYGLIVEPDSAANFVPLDGADNWLHFFLAAGMVLLGLMVGVPNRRVEPRG